MHIDTRACVSVFVLARLFISAFSSFRRISSFEAASPPPRSATAPLDNAEGKHKHAMLSPYLIAFHTL